MKKGTIALIVFWAVSLGLFISNLILRLFGLMLVYTCVVFWASMISSTALSIILLSKLIEKRVIDKNRRISLKALVITLPLSLLFVFSVVLIHFGLEGDIPLGYYSSPEKRHSLVVMKNMFWDAYTAYPMVNESFIAIPELISDEDYSGDEDLLPGLALMPMTFPNEDEEYEHVDVEVDWEGENLALVYVQFDDTYNDTFAVDFDTPKVFYVD
jgi:hypothetical protein